MTTNERIWTIEEIAEYLKINHQTVRKLIRDGEIEAFRVGTQYRVHDAELIKFMQKPQ